MDGLASRPQSSPIEVALQGAPRAYAHSVLKRAVDLTAASVGLLATGALLPIVALAIKLDSRGPVLFLQPRLGLNGRVFQIVKFRTMKSPPGGDNGAPWTMPQDTRITRVGQLLRALYIDEFPQCWNVLVGHMSAIGPRPEQPGQAAKVLDKVPDFGQRLAVKPGLTGLAQVRYGYANTMRDAAVKLRYDMLYIRSCSLWLDLKIFALTMSRVVCRKGT